MMLQLQQHVEHLFSAYKATIQIKELKQEILSNLEAKVADLTESGMSLDQAITMAIDDIDSIDGLIDDHSQIYIHRFQVELVQIALLYTVIAWLFTIPLGILSTTQPLSKFLFVAIIVLGVGFLLLNRIKHDHWRNKVTTYAIESWLQYRKMAWILWALFIIVSFSTTTAIRFGSNIWFMRPIHIDGPYQFALTAIPYLLPLISIIIPLMFNSALRIWNKYEVGASYEE